MAEIPQPDSLKSPNAKFGDHLRALALMTDDKTPLNKALEMAVSERLEKEKGMGPPKEPPKEAYEEGYLYQKGELEKLKKSKP